MKILISGAGISGLTLAYWLHKYGFKPTVIEIAPKLRNKGYMMDFFSSGYDVADAMGLASKLWEIDKTHDFDELIFLKSNGERLGGMKREMVRGFIGGKYTSIMRGELEDIIYEKVKNTVPIRFGVSIKSLKQSKESVKVTFEDSKKESFDLVIGADGIHSKVRELVFGPIEKFRHFLGYTVAAFLFKNKKKMGMNLYMCSQVDRVVGYHPLDKDMAATFMVFKSKRLGLPSLEERKKILREEFKSEGGPFADLLESMEGADEIFFDEVSQIKMPHWSKGRVSLVGDAGACLTLLAGQGAGMGMTEAYVLATELKKAKGDHVQAFKGYEKALKKLVHQKQVEAENFIPSFVPPSRWKFLMANLATRFIHWPFIAKFVLSGNDLTSVFDEDYKMDDER